MNDTVIQVEGLSKQYQLGSIGYGTLRHDLQSQWAKIRGKPDPNSRIEEKNRIDTHRDFWALRDLCFEVKRGDRLGVIGKNGAGKSTLLRVLSRITTPTSGIVRIKGKVASLLEVGTGFHAELTGRENVFLNGAIMGMKRREIQNKFDEIVHFAGVEDFIDTPVKRYSSGMYVRLGFAVAAHLDPDILIVDEVLAVGDSEFQKKCIGKMESVSRDYGRTVLFVSHNMTAVSQLCENGILLNGGRLVSTGSIGKIVSTYLSTFAAQTQNICDRDRPSWVNLKAKIINLTVRAAGKANPTTIDPEEPFSVELAIEARESVDASAWVIIQNESGLTVLFFESASLQNKMFSLSQGLSRIRLEIEKTGLTSGPYSLGVGLLVPNLLWFDQVRDAYRFSIANCDPFKNGFNLSQTLAAYHVDHTWVQEPGS